MGKKKNIEWFSKLKSKTEEVRASSKRKKKIRKRAKGEYGQFKSFLLSFDFIHFLFFRRKNNYEFNKLRNYNSNIAVENLIKGLGGEKNLLNVKNTIYGLRINFKSDYLLNRDLLFKCGGLDIKIVNKSFFSIFDKKETKLISQKIKQRIRDSRRKHRPLEVD